MSDSPSNSSGWLESLRRIGESLLALTRSRFELFAVEWQEEKLRLLHLLIWFILAVTIGVAGVFIGLLTLAIWLWDVVGYPGLIGLIVATLTVAGGILWQLQRRIQTGPTPFAQTVDEFRKDGECLRKND
jgi:uncharacterized membrane protein YqjE